MNARCLPALLAILAAGCAGAPGAEPRTSASLGRDDVQADVAALERTLDQAFAPRVFVTDDTWRTFRGRLARIAERGSDAKALCDALGDALSYVGAPDLFATLADAGERCGGPEGRRLAYVADRSGTGLAAGAEKSYALATEPDGVVILAVRRFDPAGAPGWQGLPAALEKAAAAPALIVDLRGAVGQDPSALLPLLSAAAGGATIHPLRAITRAENDTAGDLRRAAMAAGGGTLRLRAPEVWSTLVGPEPPPPKEPPSQVRKVLVGEGCEEACELVARSLQAYAGAEVFGRVGSEHRLPTGDPGLLVLPRSHVRIHLPTAAYVVNERVARVTGDRFGWFDRNAYGQVRPESVFAYDVLPPALAKVRSVLDVRRRLARWATAEPTPCSALPRVARLEDLPAQARARVRYDGTPLARAWMRVTLDLPPARGLAYLRGCPGLQVGSALGSERTDALVGASSLDPLLQLAQSEAVDVIVIEQRHEPVPN